MLCASRSYLCWKRGTRSAWRRIELGMMRSTSRASRRARWTTPRRCSRRSGWRGSKRIARSGRPGSLRRARPLMSRLARTRNSSTSRTPSRARSRGREDVGRSTWMIWSIGYHSHHCKRCLGISTFINRSSIKFSNF